MLPSLRQLYLLIISAVNRRRVLRCATRYQPGSASQCAVSPSASLCRLQLLRARVTVGERPGQRRNAEEPDTRLDTGWTQAGHSTAKRLEQAEVQNGRLVERTNQIEAVQLDLRCQNPHSQARSESSQHRYLPHLDATSYTGRARCGIRGVCALRHFEGGKEKVSV